MALGGGIKFENYDADHDWINIDLAKAVNESGIDRYIYFKEIVNLINETRNESTIFKYILMYLKNKVPKLNGKIKEEEENRLFYINNEDKSLQEKYVFYLCFNYCNLLNLDNENDTISLIYIMYSLTVSELKKSNYKIYSYNPDVDVDEREQYYVDIINAFTKTAETLSNANQFTPDDYEDDILDVDLTPIINNANGNLVNNQDPDDYTKILDITNHIELIMNGVKQEIEIGFFIANDHELYNILYE